LHPPHALGGGALLVAEITSGGVGGALATITSLPPWLGGALSALLVGVLLRLADAPLRAASDRLAARVTPPPPAPPAPPPSAP